MKRSNTANVDPRTINFADVKKRLEDKIDKINSYKSKKGMYRQTSEPINLNFPPAQEQSSSIADQNKIQAQQTATPAFTGSQSQDQLQPQGAFDNNRAGAGKSSFGNQSAYSPLGSQDSKGQLGSSYLPQSRSGAESSQVGRDSQLDSGGFRTLGQTSYDSQERNSGSQYKKSSPLYNNVIKNNYSSPKGDSYYGTKEREDYNVPQPLQSQDKTQLGTNNLQQGFDNYESPQSQRFNDKFSNPRVEEYGVNNIDNHSPTANPSENYYDIHKKLDFLEQERLNDLRSRAEDSKLSYLARDLEKIDGKIENLQATSAVHNFATPIDISLELIQRKLDKLEQDRIDSLRSKIEEERTKEIEKSISKLEAKIDSKEVIPEQNKQSSELLELIQRKIERLEEDRIDSLRAKIEEDRSVEIVKNLEKIESKISAKADKSPIAQTAYFDVLSQEDLLRKLEKLEQDRVNDLKDIMEQEKILLLNQKIEKLESKIDQAMLNSPVVGVDNSIGIAKKLERLEQNQIEELKSQREEEKLLALSKSLSNIESKLENSQNPHNQQSGVIEKLLTDILHRLDKLEINNVSHIQPNIENSALEKTIEKLESKIEKILSPTDASKVAKYSSTLEAIERKLERLEKDRADDFKEKTEENRLSSLERGLERIEDNLTSYQRFPYRTGSESEGFGKKFDRLEQESEEGFYSSRRFDKTEKLQDSLNKIESKLDYIKDSSLPLSSLRNQDGLSLSFSELSKRLEAIEKRRLEERDFGIQNIENSKLTKVLESIDSKLNTSLLNQHSSTREEKNDFIIEDIQRKLNKLEESKVDDISLKLEEEKYNRLSNHLEKIDSKISNGLQQNPSNSPVLDKTMEEIQKKLNKLEESKVDDISLKLEEEKYNRLSNHLEKIDSKISNGYKNSDNNNISQIVNKLSNLDHKFSNEVNNIKENLVFNKLTDKVSELSSKLDQNQRFQQNNSTQKEVIYKNDTNSDSIEKLSERLSELKSKVEQKSIPSEVTPQIIIEKEISKKEDISNHILPDIKNPLEELSKKFDNTSEQSGLNATIGEIQKKLSKLENTFVLETNKSKVEDNAISQHIIDKNNTILENISSYLHNLTEEFKNLYAKEFPKNSDLSNQNVMNFLENLQSKYLNSLQEIERSLKETYKNDHEIKKYLLEQDLASTEISKLQGDLLSKKNSAQTSLLVNEINKLKTHIDSKTPVSNDFPREVSVVLNDIKSQQEIIKKSLEVLPKESLISSNSSNDNNPLIEDIKNLLSEVNYRNIVLSETVDDNHNRLSNVVNKVDALSYSISQIEDLVNKISQSENITDQYKESLEQNFAKLKEDNYKIIEVLHNNSMQSTLLSEKADLLIKKLREDIVNISVLEKKSILEEFSNVKSSVEKFKELINNQDLKEDRVLSSLDKIVSNLDSITNLQEDTLNYFKDLDSNIEKNLIHIQQNSNGENDNLISEVRLYLEDSKNKVQYFNQLKDKIDQNSIIITDFLIKADDIPTKLVDFTSHFKGSLEGLSKAISYLLENHNKTAENLNLLVEKTDKLLVVETQNLKNKLDDIDDLQKQSLQASRLIDEKTNNMQSAITSIITGLDNTMINNVELINTNIDKSKEEISILIKDSSNKVEDIQKDLSVVSVDLNTLSFKSENVSLNIKELSDNVVEAKENIVSEVENSSSSSVYELINLQKALSNISSDIKILSSNTEEIKIDVKESKDFLNDVSESIKIAVSSIDNINFNDTLKNISEKISILKDKQKYIEDLINGFQKEIQSNLSPYVVDKNFLENFSKFADFSSQSIQNLKESIQSFHTNLNMYLVEDKIMTNDKLVGLLTGFEKIIDFQDNFFKIYTLNSDRLMNFAKKAEITIPEVDAKKAEEIHSNIKKSIIDVSLKNKKEDIKNIVSSNNAKNSKKVDLLANMDYLNKEITKKTKK